MIKLLFSLLIFIIPAFNPGGATESLLVSNPGNNLYTTLNLAEIGLSKDVFDLAIKGLHRLDSTGKLQNPNLITIADYSQSSNKKRLYVIDLMNNELLFNTYVAHGRNTGGEFAESFSNAEGSLKSSLGFYITEKPITGPHTGYSLMIAGVEKGFNDNAEKREIIIHAADYATEAFIKQHGRLGRSLGCPVLPPELNKPIIETIQGGTCLFVYHPDSGYLASSTLLK